MAIENWYSPADILRFYQHLNERFTFITTVKHGHLTIVNEPKPDVIQQIINDFLADEVTLRLFPHDIASILTPYHIDTLQVLVSNNWLRSDDNILYFQILDHLTIDAGTANFARQLPLIAETLYHESYSRSNIDRATVYRFLEEFQKDHPADDNNKVHINFDYIYNRTIPTGVYYMSAFDFAREQSKINDLRVDEIDYYLKLSFDVKVMPIIIDKISLQWDEEDYRPAIAQDLTELRDKKVKLKRHLHNSIANQTQADLIFAKLTASIESYDPLCTIEEEFRTIESAIKNTDQGVYDHVKDVKSIVLPCPLVAPVDFVRGDALPQVTAKSPSYLAWLFPVAIVAFVVVVAARPAYHYFKNSTLWGKNPAADDDVEKNLLLEKDQESESRYALKKK